MRQPHSNGQSDTYSGTQMLEVRAPSFLMIVFNHVLGTIYS
jgi:hypothetical protein